MCVNGGGDNYGMVVVVVEEAPIVNLSSQGRRPVVAPVTDADDVDKSEQLKAAVKPLTTDWRSIRLAHRPSSPYYSS